MLTERLDDDAPSSVDQGEQMGDSVPSASSVPQASAPGSMAGSPFHAAAIVGKIEAARTEIAGMSAGTVFNQEKVKSTMEKAMKAAEDMVTFGQGNVEAFLKSGQIWAAGVQDLGRHFAESAQAQIEETVSTMKAIAGVKSVKEAMELQSTLARSSMGNVVAATSKLTDASMKLTEQAIAPLTARVSLAVEKFGRAG